jgi:cytochrome c553
MGSIMKNRLGIAALFALLVPFIATHAHAEGGPPAWAYPVNPPDFKLAPDDGKLRHVPDSTAALSVGQTRDRFLAPDWHPADHPALPDVVAHGRKPDVWACGFCHRADGPGGPENADLAGLPAAYIVQQMADFKSGLRKSSVPKRAPPTLMVSVAKAANRDDVEAAAAYFSALKPRAKIKVVETDAAPKTYVAGWFLADAKSGEKESIGNRIIEVPEDIAQFENRDARSRFIAYVPPGSIRKGELLASTGGGKTVQCGICHGPDLRGLGPVPSISGRSPSYIVRQLYDFQHGERAGSWSPLMAGVVTKLNEEDLVSLAAYLASREP